VVRTRRVEPGVLSQGHLEETMEQHLIWGVSAALEIFACAKCSRAIARRKHRSVDNWTYLAFVLNVGAVLLVTCLRRRSDERVRPIQGAK
jgi:hypothetical protein